MYKHLQEQLYLIYRKKLHVAHFIGRLPKALRCKGKYKRTELDTIRMGYVDTEYLIQLEQKTPPDTTQHGARPMQPRQHGRGCKGHGARETSPSPPRPPERAPESTYEPPLHTSGNHMLTDTQHVLPPSGPEHKRDPMGMPRSMPKEPRGNCICLKCVIQYIIT